MLGARVGRPKSENPISVHTSVRFDAKTDKKLSDYCENHNISKGEAVRAGVLMLLNSEQEEGFLNE